MAVLLLLLHILALFATSTAVDHRPRFTDPSHSSLSLVPPQVTQACRATRFQDLCVSSLSRSKLASPPLSVILAAVAVSSDGLNTAQSMVKSVLASSSGHRSLNLTVHSKNCLQILPLSQHRMGLTVAVLPRGRIKDSRAYMSAALEYQYDCWSELSYSNETKMVDQTMSYLNTLMSLTSNALSMIVAYDVRGTAMGSWSPPATERAGFWESRPGRGPASGFPGGVPLGLAADATVCKGGGRGCHRTVQEAVNAAPNNGERGRRFVIHIEEGVYEEIVRVPLEKKNVVFVGDGVGKTVITGSLNAAMPGIFTYNTATVGVFGDGFMARGITFQNTAGPDVHQAVAFRSDSDLSVVEDCEFLGNQDTLYAHSLRQFYKSCRIEGNVDFIFGNAAAVFQDCTILVRPRQVNPEKGENNAVTASGRTDPAQSTGLVFHGCSINGTERYMELYRSNPKVHKNFLGRPWKEYSRTVFIQCRMEELITREGWMPFRQDFALKTLYYGEYGNSGPGSDLSGRVSWSSRIPAEHLNEYSVQNFIQGTDWIPPSSSSPS
ncbi:probable pectinesterase/pectinesterase inhibitor 51 [Rhodamnia argentea]|uniref:Probable pectinesterase/pectinesterase inhibitor 51 n=1 Tax=Rhodamnia argentea TaxID=178133 RepID=A0A8B8MQJ4_9MYRT|nr:probable pectinesterase/pectinesterase inhibitor 51 [Rhodamnia argentea]